MKEKICFTILMVMFVLPISAYDYVQDGIGYTVNDSTKTAFVAGLEEVVENVVIPEAIIVNGKRYPVTTIGNYAFRGCYDLTSITIGNGVTTIGGSAFRDCEGLTSITIPSSVTSIGEYAFSGCSCLTSITIGNGVTTIGEYAFRGCYGLTSITIPSSVTSIGGSAFRDCSGLTSITIGNGVTTIGEYAFSGCSGLTSITIGNGVTSIGKWAFSGCYRLQTIYCLNPTPPTCFNYMFIIDEISSNREIYTYAILHVPMGSGEVYGSAYGWRYFNKIKEDMESDGKVYYANLTVKQGTTGYTRQAIKAAETYTIYIGSLGEYKVNSVTFNGVDVTDQVVNGNYTTPEIKGESVLSIAYEAYEVSTEINPMRLGQVKVTGNDGRINISQIDEPADVMVYSVEGKLIDSVPSAFGSVSIQASREQVYIVKVGARTYKIAL